jgi:hypothetical protein
VPGLVLLLQAHSIILIPPGSILRGSQPAALYKAVIIGLAWFALIVAFVLTLLYFYARRMIDRDTGAAASP